MKEKWSLIIGFIKSNSILVTTTFISGLVYNVFMLLIPISIGRFYEFNFGFSSQRLKLLESVPFINTDIFTEFLLFFILIVLMRFVFEYINKYLIALIGEGFAKSLREQLFEHQLQINTSIYDEKGIGKYLLRYSGDLKSIQNYIAKGLFKFSQDIILILFLLVTISFFNINLATILTVFIVLAYVILFFINKVLYNISVSRRNQRSGLLTFVNTRLRAISSIKAFNKYHIEQKRYNKRSERLYRTGKKYQLVANLVFSFIPAINYLMIAFLMWYVYYIKTQMDDTFDQTAFLILILLIISILPILRNTLRVSIVWKLGNISFEKLLVIFSFEAENRLPLEKISFSNRNIRLKNVMFKYNGSDNLALDQLNMSFPPKNLSVVTGGPGSGKSTLINLILKMHEPTSGEICYGKYEQKTLSEKSIRRNVSIVSDEFPLYGKTVHEAIAYSRSDEKKQKAAELLEDLQKYEDSTNKLKIDDTIGDLGRSLTSGQKRILMYCRALLTSKPWLIINEPFKNLKPETSDLLKDRLNTLSNKKGIIIFDSETPKGLDPKKLIVL